MFSCNQQNASPNNKVQGANMGPIWGLQDPGGSYVGPMNLAIWEVGCKYGWLNWNIDYQPCAQLSVLKAESESSRCFQCLVTLGVVLQVESSVCWNQD